MKSFAEFGRRRRRRHVGEFGRRRRRRHVGEFGRRRRHRRHFRGFGDLGAITGPVKGSEVLAGLAVGLVGVAVAKAASKQVSGLSDTVDKALPILGSLVSGGLAWFVFRKRKPELARSLLLGSLSVGVVTTGWGLLQNQFPQLQDLVRLRLAMAVRRGGQMGLPVSRTDARALNPNLAALTAVSLQSGRANLAGINALVQRRAMRQ